MKNYEGLLKIREIFRECADIVDKVIELDQKEELGEDDKLDLERLMGRYVILVMELNSSSLSM
ncbi:hypothetical protein [Clostridium perfringens]|uniref:hypothetical protein n=1 Tax=Clostridium perfringens TaxID=1502 RepID=UPI0022E38F1E|nr:hypothetical protein [Clostridium perfringens]